MGKKEHVCSVGVIPPHYFKDKNLDILRDIYRCSTEINRSMDEVLIAHIFTVYKEARTHKDFIYMCKPIVRRTWIASGNNLPTLLVYGRDFIDAYAVAKAHNSNYSKVQLLEDSRRLREVQQQQCKDVDLFADYFPTFDD